MKERLKIKWNNELAIAILFFGPQINYYIANLLSTGGLPSITPFVYALLCVIGVAAYVLAMRKKAAFFTFAFLIVALIISALINDKTQQFMFGSNLFSSAIVILLFMYFPVFILMAGEIDFDRMMRYFRNASMITIIISTISFLDYLFINSLPPPDYMSFAYMMLNPALVCFMFGWKGNKFAFVLSVMALFVVFIVGCRGAVVSIAVFLFLYVTEFFLKGRNDLKGFALKIFLLFLIVIIAINIDSVLEYIYDFLEDIGFASRTVDKLSLGADNFAQSETRVDIWKQAASNIGVFGKGLFGDRTFILDEYRNPIYAHNLILELFVDFGFIFGTLMVLFLLFLIIKALIISIKSGSQILIKMSFAMISVLFVKHMISASFLTSFDFWLYLGFAASVVMNQDNTLKKKPQKT